MSKTPDPVAAPPESDIPDRLAYNVVLPDFEGPLDLLLFLCKSHEIDIVNIPIAFVTSKYLEYLDLMQQMSVEVAGEYLVMAATLCYLKSRELVPTPEPLEVAGQDEDESGMDPREELIRRLLEYQKYKDAAAQLGGRPVEGRNVFGRGMPVLDGPRPEGDLAEHSPWKLIEAFAELIAKAGPAATHDVVMDRMSVADRINELVDRLEREDGSFRFDSIIDFQAPPADVRHQLVITLLAILELARMQAIRVMQDVASQTFFITRTSGDASVLAAAREAHVTSDDNAEAAPATGATEREEPVSVTEDQNGETQNDQGE